MREDKKPCCNCTQVLFWLNELFLWYQAFFAEHPEFAENDFYITGESYAGHYIPAFAARVHRGNKANEGIHINLKVCHWCLI